MTFSVSAYNKARLDYKANWKARMTRFALSTRNSLTTSEVWNQCQTLDHRPLLRDWRRTKNRKRRYQGSAMEKLCAHFWRNRLSVDKIIASLRPVKEPLTPAKLGQIADAHGKLLRIVQRRLKKKKQKPRSFLSKYLHFHNPAVPIFDSVVVKGMRKLYAHRRNDGSVSASRIRDDDYRSFLMRFWFLYEDVRRSGATPTVRFLDYYLLCLEEGK